MEYVIWYFRDMKLGHILGTRSIKTAGFNWNLRGISTEEKTYKSSHIKDSWRFLTIAKTRARKLEIKCSDELPWVRIPPSLPLKNKASKVFAWKPFSVLFLFLTAFLTAWLSLGIVFFTLDYDCSYSAAFSSCKNLPTASSHGGRRWKPASSSDFLLRREFFGRVALVGYICEGTFVTLTSMPA